MAIPNHVQITENVKVCLNPVYVYVLRFSIYAFQFFLTGLIKHV